MTALRGTLEVLRWRWLVAAGASVEPQWMPTVAVLQRVYGLPWQVSVGLLGLHSVWWVLVRRGERGVAKVSGIHRGPVAGAE